MNIVQITKGCQEKNPKYQRELVLRFSSMLMTVSRRYAPDHMSAQDVLQESFIKIFKYIQSFDSNKGNIEGWMRKIVINTALKRLDKKCFKNEKPTDQLPEVKVEASIYEKLDAEDIIAVVNTLPDGYRQVFNMYAIEGYSHKEIGAILGINETTSRSNYSRARQLLRTKLNGQKNLKPWVKTG